MKQGENDLYTRMKWYSFLRSSRKPRKGEEKAYVLPSIGDEEKVDDYLVRCKKSIGVIPSPIRKDKKKFKRNEKCFCESGKKYKTCHGRS